MHDILPRDATALLADLKSGALTATALAEAHLDRIAEREPEVHAWAYLDPAAVRGRAAELDAIPQNERGALHGLPIGIKDVLLTRDMPTRYNCDLYADAPASADAACVALLREAGALILGKTETVELASIGRPAPTRNPHALDHTPGGSSSGSAAAVADGHVPVALGTQTGGSIVRPASFCGVWALKPTWGTVGVDGMKPFAPSLDTIGWFGRSPADLATLLNVFDPGPALPMVELAGARIGLWRTAGWPQADTTTRDAMARIADRFRAAGASVEDFDLPFPTLAATQLVIMREEGRRSFKADVQRGGERLHPRIVEMVATGGGVTRDELRAAYDLAAEARAAFDHLAAPYDAILAPSTVGSAPAGLASTGNLLFNGLLTLLHVPCVNLPAGRAENGLPVGVTLTGPRFADRRVIAVAHAFSVAAPHEP